MYEFQGKLLSEGKASFRLEHQFVDIIDLGQRERKVKKKDNNLNIDNMFREMNEQTKKKKPKIKKVKNWRNENGGGFDHQFFNEHRLDELEKKLNN